MEYKELYRLIHRYQEGLTDKAEEEKIREYFRTKRVLPDDMESYRNLFDFFRHEGKEQSQLSFEELEEAESTPRHYPGTAKKRTLQVLAVAASLLLLTGIFYIHQKQQEQQVYAVINGQPVTNQQKAYEQTQRALQMVSSNFNYGTADLQKLSKFHQTKELITKKQGL